MPRDGLSRRQFLVHSAGIAGASLGLGATRPARGQGHGPEVRLGFIGLGDRGRQLLGAALESPDALVVGLSDVHPERLKKGLDMARRASSEPRRGAPSPRGFTDCRALLESKDIDAVFIATPAFLHVQQTLDALEAGKHVYCEKPLAIDPEGSRRVLVACREAERRGQIYQSGLQRRYNPRYRRSIDFVRSGEAGAVRFVRAQWHAVASLRKDKPWVNRREKSGGIVLEQAIHQLDVFNWLFGERPVAATGAGFAGMLEGPPGRDVLDYYGVVLKYPGGGLVQVSHVMQSIPERRFSGIHEYAFCDLAGVDLGAALAWDREGRTRSLPAERGNETRLAVEAFIDSLIRGRHPVASAEAAYDAALAALLCRRAIETERRVTFAEVEGAAG